MCHCTTHNKTDGGKGGGGGEEAGDALKRIDSTPFCEIELDEDE
jgi:hypothetical protein